MTRRIQITSRSNERLKGVRRLARRRAPDRFVIEGYRQLRSALDANARVREVYAAPALFLGNDDGALVARAERLGAVAHELSRSAFLSLSGRVRADGLLAVVERPSTELADVGAFVAVAQGIERPGNLGALVRTACAAGVETLIVADGRTDLFHPDAVRGSVGTIFRVQLVQASTAEALAGLTEHRILVATPDAAVPYWAAGYEGPTAIVLGGERHGVGAAWFEAADATVSIPMAPAADSLNVAVAAGVVLLEAARQRGAGQAPVDGGARVA